VRRSQFQAELANVKRVDEEKKQKREKHKVPNFHSLSDLGRKRQPGDKKRKQLHKREEGKKSRWKKQRVLENIDRLLFHNTSPQNLPQFLWKQQLLKPGRLFF
jgi:hypothetical protein